MNTLCLSVFDRSYFCFKRKLQKTCLGLAMLIASASATLSTRLGEEAEDSLAVWRGVGERWDQKQKISRLLKISDLVGSFKTVLENQ